MTGSDIAVQYKLLYNGMYYDVTDYLRAWVSKGGKRSVIQELHKRLIDKLPWPEHGDWWPNTTSNWRPPAQTPTRRTGGAAGGPHPGKKKGRNGNRRQF